MSILDEIIAHKREELSQSLSRRPLGEIKAALADCPPDLPGRFERALLNAAPPVALIAEIKKASPSKGLIREDFQPAALARQYADGGAAALSVLTDRKYFQGDPDFLVQTREAVDIPVLRKDFILSEYQVFESALLGADCILLIAAALDDPLLSGLYQLAGSLGLDVLVEVHDKAEAERAARIGVRIVGVNNRDLGTFEVSLETSERLAPLLSGAVVRVSESGISARADLDRLAAFGYRAVLVGEHLMRRPDITAATRELLGAVS